MDAPSSLEERIAALPDKWSGRRLGEVARITCTESAGQTNIAIVLGYPGAQDNGELLDQVHELAGAVAVAVKITQQIVAHAITQGAKLMPGVRNLIAVASGKGGVGKSTSAVNLAIALAQLGARVGILDADIYGPSVPTLLGIADQKPQSLDGKIMQPLRAHGVQAMSIGFLVDVEQPMVWRGPMATQALRQLITETAWDDLDYLIVDMPPGTGDIQLTLAQSVPVTGAVIITTPQDLALLDARKGIRMFEKVAVPILGIVENMAIHICSSCGHEEAIFGVGGAAKLSADYHTTLLGQLPLAMPIRVQADSGSPIALAEGGSVYARAYHDIALRLTSGLAARKKEQSHKFPRIVVQNT